MINNIFKQKKSSIKKEKPKEKIIIDYREKKSLVPSCLQKNLQIEFKELKVGDYLIKDTIIERKEIKDFAASIINKRIFKQLEEIKQYPNYLLILEGNIYSTHLHENVIKGVILAISIKYKVPVIQTKNEEETASYLELISRKQTREKNLNPKKKNISPNEQLQFTLESFPNIGPTISKNLLKEFKTLKKIFNLEEKELFPFLGKKAVNFLNILNYRYQK